MDYKNQIHPDQAVKILLDLPIKYEAEEVELEHAMGRVVFDHIYATLNVPSFDKSPYDGYALRGEETRGASEKSPIEFKVVEEIPAGYEPKKSLGPFEAAKILTGASLPKGANVCVKYENTDFTHDRVTINTELKPNSDIIKVGEDVKRGSLLVERGSLVTPGLMGLLASQGLVKVKVYKRPRVGIMATGSELKSRGDRLEGGQIYETNLLVFKGIFEKLGFEVVDFGLVEDDEKLIQAKTKEAVKKVDVFVTTGGASVGDYDYALSSVKNLGGRNLFWKTAMKPGGSIVASILDDTLILGLSGNPGAGILGLYRVAFPYLKKVCGRKDVDFKRYRLLLKEPITKKSPRLRLLRGNIEFGEDARAYFVEKNDQGNGTLSSFVDCDYLGEIRAGSDEVDRETLIDCYKVDSIFGSVGV